MSCETFVNEFVRAIEDGTLPEFRNRARDTSVLVIDDVQFLANRESSQEELFHTFNVLYQNRSQIILSADARPTEIPTLEDRLVSRFNWGLVTQIDPPNRETRHAILAKKARLRGCEIPVEVLDFIAQRVDDNVRVLEGALTKLISEAQIADMPLTVETARRVLQDIHGFESRRLQVGDIIQQVAQHYGIKVAEILGRKRSRSIALPRQVAMYLTRKLTPLSLEEIGGHFGGRDHSTVLHAERTIEAEKSRDPAMADTLAKLSRQLLAPH
jgi:chromosomal replication initiator protein